MILIAIIGNICSGKSTVARHLSQLNPNYKLLSIDDYRLQYNKENNKAGEYKAQEQLREDLLSTKFAILEMSGASQRFISLMAETFKLGSQNIVVKLKCARHVLLQRFVDRQESSYPKIPFPYNLNKEKSIEHIDSKLQSISADYVFNTDKMAAVEIAKLISGYIQGTPYVKEEEKPESTISIEPVNEILSCVQNFDYDKALELFKKYLPTKKYLYKKFTQRKNKRHERQLINHLKIVAASPEKLIKREHIPEVSNISKAAQTNQNYTPRKVNGYPETLEEMIVQRGKMINQKKILSNNLHTLINKPTEAKEAVQSIIALKGRIDAIDRNQRHFERHSKLPKKLERYKKEYSSLEEIEHAIKLARSRISKTKNKIERAKANDNTELYSKYALAMQKEETFIKELTKKKLTYGY